MSSDDADPDSNGWRSGVRASVPLLLPTLAIGLTFGVLAEPMIGALPAVLMSALVWAGTAQFAALTAIGGGPAISIATGLLANLRYLPMGFAIAPSLHAPAWRRAASGLALADASFALSHRRSGGFDIGTLEGAAPIQYAGWVGGTSLGVVGASLVSDPATLGLGVFFPVFYLAILIPEIRASWRPAVVAAVSAAITALLIPHTSAGVAVLAGASAALLGLRKPS